MKQEQQNPRVQVGGTEPHKEEGHLISLKRKEDRIDERADAHSHLVVEE